VEVDPVAVKGTDWFTVPAAGPLTVGAVTVSGGVILIITTNCDFDELVPGVITASA